MQRKLKIVHVTPTLDKGGGERVVIDLANEQAARGHDVTVIIGHAVPERIAAVFDAAVATRVIYRSPPSKTGKYLGIVPWQIRHLSWLKSRDILHCHLTFGAVFASLCKPLLSIGGRRVKIVETYQAVGMKIPDGMRRFHARLARSRDALVLMASDDFWRKFVDDHPAMKIVYIKNGVNSPRGRVGSPADRAAYRQRIGIPQDCRYVVGTVGQFRPDRQPWLHIDVFARIAKALGREVHFVIAGDGAARGRVEEAIVAHGLEGQVHLIGVTASAAEPASIMDLYITLAVGPVVGIAALEAIFAEVPTIAIQLNQEYRANDDDFVWSSTDLDAVGDAAIRLLRDADSQRDLVSAQSAYAKSTYGMQGMGEKYDDLYYGLLE